MAARRSDRRGSVLLPMVGAMLILLLTGTALSELFGAQRMRSVLAVEAAQAYWAAEAGLWHAAYLGEEITTPTNFGGAVYTVSKSGTTYTATSQRSNAAREVSFTFTASGSGSGSSSTPTPIAHWALDESSGTTAADSIDGNDGTLNSGVTVGASGPPGGGTAMEFDGSNDYVAIPHSADYLIDAGTVQLWLNADDTSGSQAFFSKDSNGYDDGGHLDIRLVGDDVEVRLQSTSSSYELDASNVISAGTWHHVALTFGSGGMRLYVDGTLEDSDSYTGGLGTSSGGTGNAEPIGLGATTWNSGNETITPLSTWYHGRLAAVAIYDVELTSTEVQALYTGGGAL